MKIKSLQIKNFKSIEDIVLTEPNPFSVFVGPNGAGKSNIFEALEFVTYLSQMPPNGALKYFGEPKDLLKTKNFAFEIDFGINPSSYIQLDQFDDTTGKISNAVKTRNFLGNEAYYVKNVAFDYETDDYNQFFKRSGRVFLGNKSKRTPTYDDNVRYVVADGSNVEKVLKRLFETDVIKEEIVEWLRILIPEFKDIQIRTSELGGEVSFSIFEKSTNKPFPKYLISDGTKNILALLTAVYQSDEPQFLCIEEPENGLHPHVIEAMVRIFRNACKEKGHYIWLNTHSETLVRQLTIDEIIVVDKKEGSTRVRQFQGQDLFGLDMDEAWLTNALGGGLP
jgi:predicted ATPase